MARGLEDGEDCALRVRNDGHSTNVFKIGRGHKESGAQLFGLASRHVAVGDVEVWQPIGGSAGAVVRSGRNAADVLLAVLDVPVVVCRLFVFLLYLPSEKIGIKLAGASLVRRVEVAPAERAVLARDANAGIPVRLPNRKGGAVGILHDGRPAGVSHIEGCRENRTAHFGGPRGRSVRTSHRDVEAPVGRHAVLQLFGSNRRSRGCVASTKLIDGIDPVRCDGNVLGRPTEDLPVKGLGGGLVGGGEFDPAEVTRGVSVDVRHRWRLRSKTVGSKRFNKNASFLDFIPEY